MEAGPSGPAGDPIEAAHRSAGASSLALLLATVAAVVTLSLAGVGAALFLSGPGAVDELGIVLAWLAPPIAGLVSVLRSDTRGRPDDDDPRAGRP